MDGNGDFQPFPMFIKVFFFIVQLIANQNLNGCLIRFQVYIHINCHSPSAQFSGHLRRVEIVSPDMCHGQGCRVFLGMGDLPPFNRNPCNGYINPYYWVDEFIPYHMEIMGV